MVRNHLRPPGLPSQITLSDGTIALYRDTVGPLREQLGDVKLKDLTAGDVQAALETLAGRLSTRSVQIIRNCLERAIRHAEIRDLTGRNVAALVKPPTGRPGRPSKSLTVDQAQALLRWCAIICRWRSSWWG